MSKVLFIDDDEDTRVMFGLYLRKEGYEVATAEDGERGIELFQRHRPPIVLTDIKMPGMDGIEVLKRIKHASPETEVIVITGHGDMDVAIQALQLDASDFVTKPILNEALSVALRRANERLDTRRMLKEYTSNLENMVKEATEELRERYEFESSLIDHSIDGIIATDKKGNIITFNQGAERIFGYSKDEVIGKLGVGHLYPPGIAEEIRQSLYSREKRREGPPAWQETAVLAKGGREIPVWFSGTLLYSNGDIIGSVGFFHDLRTIKQLQQQLVISERLSATGQAVTGMAHYVKNILNGLKFGVYIVNTSLKENKPDLLPKGWTMVEKNIGKISDLVMNMLIYSKDREPDCENCYPNDIAEEVCGLVEEQAKKSKVKLIKDFDLSVNQCYLDPNGLHRCLLNLVTNAIDACIHDPQEDKDWSVTIRTRKEGDGVRLDVADNGMGMTKEVQDKLFEGFFSTKGGKGTGLGLLVTSKIMDEHGGDLSFESEPGKGTTFSISFPGRRKKGE